MRVGLSHRAALSLTQPPSPSRRLRRRTQAWSRPPPPRTRRSPAGPSRSWCCYRRTGRRRRWSRHRGSWRCCWRRVEPAGTLVQGTRYSGDSSPRYIVSRGLQSKVHCTAGNLVQGTRYRGGDSSPRYTVQQGHKSKIRCTAGTLVQGTRYRGDFSPRYTAERGLQSKIHGTAGTPKLRLAESCTFG